MIRNTLSIDAHNLAEVSIWQSAGNYLPKLTQLRFQLADSQSEFSIWVTPKDLPRIAGMLRQAAEELESPPGTEIPDESGVAQQTS